MQATMTAPLMSSEDVADALSISEKHARALMKLPDFPLMQVGLKRTYRVRPADFEKWVTTRYINRSEPTPD